MDGHDLEKLLKFVHAKLEYFKIAIFSRHNCDIPTILIMLRKWIYL